MRAARLGLSRQGEGPPVPIDEILDALDVRPDGIVAMRSSAPGRWIVGIEEVGRQSAVVKIGSRGDESLRWEAMILESLGGTHAGYAVPRLRSRDEVGEWQFLEMSPLRVTPFGSVTLAEAVDVATELCRESEQRRPIVHGDFTPWNVVPLIGGGIGVLDWERAAWEARPLWDLSHFVAQSGALLGNPSPRQAVELLTGSGSPGQRHLAQLGVDVSLAPALLADYIARCDEEHYDKSAWFRSHMARLLTER